MFTDFPLVRGLRRAVGGLTLALLALAPAEARTIWSGKLTVAHHAFSGSFAGHSYAGCTNLTSTIRCTDGNRLTNATFIYRRFQSQGVASYLVRGVYIYDAPSFTGRLVLITANGSGDGTGFPQDLLASGILTVDGRDFRFSDGTVYNNSEYRWANSGLSWTAGQMVSLSLKVMELTAYEVTTTSAKLHMSPLPDYGWYYKADKGPHTTCTSTNANRIIINGLTPNTTYNYKAYSDSDCTDELTGDVTDANFTTAAPPPTPAELLLNPVNTGRLSVDNITSTGARLIVSDHTGSWYYVADKGPHVGCTASQWDVGDRTTLSGLTPNTAYTYRAYGRLTDACSGKNELGSSTFGTREASEEPEVPRTPLDEKYFVACGSGNRLSTGTSLDFTVSADNCAVGDLCYRGSTSGFTFGSWSAAGQWWRPHRDAALFEAGPQTADGEGFKRAISFRNLPPTNDADGHFVFDIKLDSASDHWIQVRAILPRGKPVVGAGKVLSAESVPEVSGLAPNFPNPFNSTTMITYHLSSPGPVQLVIYNVLGQPVRTLVDASQTAGSYQIQWDVLDQRGVSLSTGVYIARLTYPGGVQMQRLLYLK